MILNSIVPSAIIGPSHAVRWSWHVRDGVVCCPLPHDRIIGVGGAPIWSMNLFQKAISAIGQNDCVAIMVPDFRFGNGICSSSVDFLGNTMQDGFLGIDSQAMTTENDLVMFELCMAALNKWHQQFGNRARYIFWCLLGRQIHDRLLGRHIQSGVYRHPVFNYEAITGALPDLDIVDMSPLLSAPMHELQRLYIDGSSHPSQIGYLLLNGLFFEKMDVLQAYERAVQDVERSLHELAKQAASAKKRKILLTGRSVWLDTLMAYMGSQGIERMAEAGLILAPLDRRPGQPSIAQTMRNVDISKCAVVVISAGGTDYSNLLGQSFNTEVGVWQDVLSIDWESATAPTIISRREVPRFARLDARLPVQGNVIIPDLRPDMIEQGPLGMPSWTGILHVLNLIISDGQQ